MMTELVGNISLIGKIGFVRIVCHENKRRGCNTYLITVENFSWTTRFRRWRMLINNDLQHCIQVRSLYTPKKLFVHLKNEIKNLVYMLPALGTYKNQRSKTDKVQSVQNLIFNFLSAFTFLFCYVPFIQNDDQ